jgi:hypothetical protein
MEDFGTLYIRFIQILGAEMASRGILTIVGEVMFTTFHKGDEIDAREGSLFNDDPAGIYPLLLP